MTEEPQGGQSAQDVRDGEINQPSSLGIASETLPEQQPDQATEGASQEVMQRFWEVVKRLPSYVRLATRIARDPDVPKQAKAVLAVGGGYAVSPIDLVPGVIPVAGQMDDVYVLLTAIQQSLKMMPAEVAERNLAASSVRREDIEADLQTVRDVVRVVFMKSVKVGGKALERISRAAFGFAREQLKRRNTGRAEKPL